MTAQAAESRSAPAMRKYARDMVAASLRRLAFQVTRAARMPNAEAIHDLRVSIRRFEECVRVFRQYLPHGKVKKIRRALADLMEAASEVRNRDVALEYLQSARVQGDKELLEKIGEQRKACERDLRVALRDWVRDHTFRKWRTRLGF